MPEMTLIEKPASPLTWLLGDAVVDERRETWPGKVMELIEAMEGGATYSAAVKRLGGSRLRAGMRGLMKVVPEIRAEIEELESWNAEARLDEAVQIADDEGSADLRVKVRMEMAKMRAAGRYGVKPEHTGVKVTVNVQSLTSEWSPVVVDGEVVKKAEVSDGA